MKNLLTLTLLTTLLLNFNSAIAKNDEPIHGLKPVHFCVDFCGDNGFFSGIPADGEEACDDSLTKDYGYWNITVIGECCCFNSSIWGNGKNNSSNGSTNKKK